MQKNNKTSGTIQDTSSFSKNNYYASKPEDPDDSTANIKDKNDMRSKGSGFNAGFSTGAPSQGQNNSNVTKGSEIIDINTLDSESECSDDVKVSGNNFWEEI